jgi:membrane protease YdiL (CAAX protease family)
MTWNYILTINSPVSVEDMMADLIAQVGTNIVLIMGLLPLAAGLFLVLGWTKLVHPQSIRSLTTAREKIDWNRILYAFTLWGALTAGLTLLDYYTSPETYVLNLNWPAFLKLAVVAILLIPLQTSFEEYLFRGHMMQGLGIIFRNRWVPLLVTSAIFGLAHMANPEVEKLGPGIMVFYIGTGLFLGIITLMDEGMELALGFHAANNLVTALLVTADWTAFQTDSILKNVAPPDLSWDAYIPTFVVLPLLLYFFGKKYGWTNWKERLTGRVLSREEALKLLKEDTSW